MSTAPVFGTAAAPPTFGVASAPPTFGLSPAATGGAAAPSFGSVVGPSPASSSAGPPEMPFSEGQAPATLLCANAGAVPRTQAVLKKSSLPLGVMVRPLGAPVPLVKVEPWGVLRCGNLATCRAYINPFCRFSRTGSGQLVWACSLCGRLSLVPEGYMSGAEESLSGGRYTHRPELVHGAVDFVATRDYISRPPQPPVFVFLLDVSHAARVGGLLSASVAAIKHALSGAVLGQPRAKVAFLTYDRQVHFFVLDESRAQPSMLVMADSEDLFLPVPDNLLVNLADARTLVDFLLENLPAMFGASSADTAATTTDSALSSALRAAYGLINHSGGRVVVLQSSRPSLGEGKLETRSAQHKDALRPNSKFYQTFALDCTRKYISVDLVTYTNLPLDLPSLACLPRLTCGEHIHVPLPLRLDPHATATSQEHLSRALTSLLTRQIGLESVLRLRVSPGLRLANLQGNVFRRKEDLLATSALDSHKSVAITFEIDDAEIKARRTVAIQAALLYSSVDGERRIRVATICLPVANNNTDVFDTLDSVVTTALMAKDAIPVMITKGVKTFREQLIGAAINILHAAGSSPAATPLANPRLSAPPAMHPLPGFLLAILKHTGFRSDPTITVDQRIVALEQVRNLPHDLLITYLVPMLYSIPPPEDVRSTPRLPVSSEHLRQDGVFLLHNGSCMYLMVGRNVPPELMTQLFGHSSIAQFPSTQLKLPTLDNPASKATCALVAHIQDQYPLIAPLCVVRQDVDLDVWPTFIDHLVYDRSQRTQTWSYFEFLNLLASKVATLKGSTW